MKRLVLIGVALAMSVGGVAAQAPPGLPPTQPIIILPPYPLPAFSPVRLISCSNSVDGTLCTLRCGKGEVIMSAVCNNHKGNIAARYLDATSAECRGVGMNDSGLALCAIEMLAQPSK